MPTQDAELRGRFEHVVQDGESLSTIIARHYEGVGFDPELILKIAAFNKLRDASTIYPGKLLVLPPLDSEALNSQSISGDLRATLRLQEAPELTPITPSARQSWPCQPASANRNWR